MKVLVASSFPTVCDPMSNCSLPGSSVCGVLQARILEWVAIFSSRGSSPTHGLNPGLLHYRQILYHLSHQGSPFQSVCLLTFFSCVIALARMNLLAISLISGRKQFCFVFTFMYDLVIDFFIAGLTKFNSCYLWNTF